MNRKLKKIGLFIGITYALSWSIAILFFIFGGKWGTPSSMIVAMVIMFMPMVSTKSVIAAAIIHGSLNSTAALAVIMTEGGNELTIGVTGAAGFIVLLIVNLGIILFDCSSREKSVSAMMN